MQARLAWLSVFAVLISSSVIAAPISGELMERLHLGMESPATAQEAEAYAVLSPFYEARGMAPLWVTGQEPNARARQLAKVLEQAGLDGLDPADYGAGELGALLEAKRPERLAALELQLSLGLIRLASDLGVGRIAPRVSDEKLYPYREVVDGSEVIRGAAEAEDLAAYLRGYQPQTPRYDRLKRALADYRSMARRGGWAPISSGPTLKPGMTGPRVAQLRARLRLWGDLSQGDDRALAGDDPAFYDEAMAEAVKHMQYRHGLAQDAAVGKATLAALNVAVDARIEQLVLNLERRRWMRDDFGQRYIFVNLADFQLKLVDEPKTLLVMRVVVGKPYYKTPVFSEEMTYVEINPFWNVPPSIARKDILPKIKQDVSYLAKHNFTLFSDWSGGAKILDPATVNWTLANGNSFPYKLRQGPGEGNSLGRLKFMFPNHFNVYLHDTPAKTLFEKATRSFSHGCIRVHDPVGLATAVLALTPDWPQQRIEATIESGKRTVVTLAEPLPVHISYLTAFANKDGSVHFRSDVYKRDEHLAGLLLGSRARQASN